MLYKVLRVPTTCLRPQGVQGQGGEGARGSEGGEVSLPK